MYHRGLVASLHFHQTYRVTHLILGNILVHVADTLRITCSHYEALKR
jgi:hypothetical protein